MLTMCLPCAYFLASQSQIFFNELLMEALKTTAMKLTFLKRKQKVYKQQKIVKPQSQHQTITHLFHIICIHISVFLGETHAGHYA